MLNKRAQIGETVTWIVATVIITFVLLFFIFGASMLAQTKNIKSYRENAFSSVKYQGDDLFFEKSLFSYHMLTKDAVKRIILKDLDEKAAKGEFLIDYNETKKGDYSEFTMNLKKNKRGDIPVTILVIGVFAVCGFALLTFFISDFSISNSFVGLEVMDKLNVMVEEYQFYSSKGSIEDLTKEFNWVEEAGVRYIEGEKSENRTDFFVFNKREVILFYAKVPLPS